MSHLLQLWIHWSRINPMIPNPYEVPVGAVAFVGVYAVTRRLQRRLTRALDQRNDAIAGGLQRAADVAADAAQVRAQYLALQAEARHDAAKLRQEAVAGGARYVAAQRDEAQLTARQVADAARSGLAAEYQHAYASLRPAAGEFAVELASRIVGEPLRSGSAGH